MAPKLLIWAKPGAVIPAKRVGQIKEEMKNLDDVYLGKGKHYLREDYPDAIGEAIVEWYRKISK